MDREPHRRSVLCTGGRRFADAARLGIYGPLTLLVEAAFPDGVVGALVAPGAATAIVLVWAYVAPVAIGVSIGRYHSVHPDLDRRDAGRRAGFGRDARLAFAAAMAVASRCRCAGGCRRPLVIWQETDFNLALLDNYRVASTSGGVARPARDRHSRRRSRTSSACCGSTSCARFEEPRLSGSSVSWPCRSPSAPRELRALSCYQAFVDLVLELRSMGAAPPCVGDDARRERVGHGHRVLDGRIRRAGGSLAGPAAGDHGRRRRSSGIRRRVVVRLADSPAGGPRRRRVRPDAAVLQTTPAARRRTGILVARPPQPRLRSSRWPLPTIGPLERLRAGIHREARQGPAGSDLALGARCLRNGIHAGDSRHAAVRRRRRRLTLLSMDYARAGGGPEVPFDNAQNWFRHQLAELGIVGCAGWLLWIVLFAGTLVRGRTRAGTRCRRQA